MAADAQLLARLRANDDTALAELYDQFAPAIYTYCYRRVGERHLAEDLTSDVFVRALASIQKGRFAHTSLPAWLYRIAHNLVVDHYRRANPDIVPLEEWAPAPDNVPEAARQRRQQESLGNAMQQLTDEQQQTLALRFGQGYTASEAARLMGKTEEAIRASQHRALAALRRMMGEGKSD